MSENKIKQQVDKNRNPNKGLPSDPEENTVGNFILYTPKRSVLIN